MDLISCEMSLISCCCFLSFLIVASCFLAYSVTTFSKVASLLIVALTAARTSLETLISSETFLRRLEARQRFYGSLIGVEHAEAFVVREALNVHDPIDLLSRRMSIYS